MTEPSMDVQFYKLADPNKVAEIMEGLTDVASPRRVFGDPVTVGDYTVITASEVGAGTGFGFGGGGAADTKSQAEGKPSTGFGTGGGGGGGSMARPVAVIAVGPNGVRVEPIVDVSKVALTLFTTLAAIVATIARVRRAAK
jgi:uncharacterized spore protein YtfJ